MKKPGMRAVVIWANGQAVNPPELVKKRPSLITKGRWDNCHVCGKRVAWNWYVRHLKSGCEVG